MKKKDWKKFFLFHAIILWIEECDLDVYFIVWKKNIKKKSEGKI